jgi:hypothetical protein
LYPETSITTPPDVGEFRLEISEIIGASNEKIEENVDLCVATVTVIP